MYNIAILRHGDANYKVQKVETEKTKFDDHEMENFKKFSHNFNDLQEENIHELVSNIHTYIKEHFETLKDKEIVIWTSPLGRTIQTTKILLEELQKSWLKVKSISVIDQLEEVKNFQRSILEAFANGWTCVVNGKQVTVDKEITNPQDLDISHYFLNNGFRKVNPGYLKQLWIYDDMQKIESYDEITERSKNTLYDTFKNIQNHEFIFLVTHQAFSDWIFLKKENYEKWWQKTWEIINFSEDELVSRV